MKQIFALSTILILLGCATAHKLNRVELGMTKTQVISVLGKPDSVAAKGSTEYLNYFLYDTDDDAWYGITADYYVRLVNGKVDSYGRMGDFDSSKD